MHFATSSYVLVSGVIPSNNADAMATNAGAVGVEDDAASGASGASITKKNDGRVAAMVGCAGTSVVRGCSSQELRGVSTK